MLFMEKFDEVISSYRTFTELRKYDAFHKKLDEVIMYVFYGSTHDVHFSNFLQGKYYLIAKY